MLSLILKKKHSLKLYEKYLVHLVVGATTLQLFGIYNNWQKVSVIFFWNSHRHERLPNSLAQQLPMSTTDLHCYKRLAPINRHLLDTAE